MDDSRAVLPVPNDPMQYLLLGSQIDLATFIWQLLVFLCSAALQLINAFIDRRGHRACATLVIMAMFDHSICRMFSMSTYGGTQYNTLCALSVEQTE